jgi:hypothetical protein
LRARTQKRAIGVAERFRALLFGNVKGAVLAGVLKRMFWVAQRKNRMHKVHVSGVRCLVYLCPVLAYPMAS